MEEFDKLIELLKLDRKESEWGRSFTMESSLKELKSEVEEIEEALKNNDIQNLKEEIGDSLGDLLFLAIIAEEKGLFSIKDSLKSMHERMKRRKPWLLKGEKVSKEEEQKIWDEIKRKERETNS